MGGTLPGLIAEGAGVPGRSDNRRVGELAAGPITMLFSDIEGSTALVSRLGDRYGEALSAHRAMLRAEFAVWRSREGCPGGA